MRTTRRWPRRSVRGTATINARLDVSHVGHPPNRKTADGAEPCHCEATILEFVRWLLLALVPVLLAPSASACTTSHEPQLRVSLVIERGDETLQDLDTGMRFTENRCFRLFWVPLLFDGWFAAWRDSSVVTVADTSTGEMEPWEASSNWTLGRGLILDLDGDLRIRSLTTGATSHVAAQNQSHWYMVDGSLAMAADENANGTPDPQEGFHFFDVVAREWFAQDVRPRSQGWPDGISAWLGFSRSWVLFEAKAGLFAYDVERKLVRGPLPEADGPGGEDPSQWQTSPTGLLGLNGAQASLRREYDVGYHTDRFWRIDIINETIVDHDRIPAPTVTVDGVTARFHLKGESIPTPSPTQNPTTGAAPGNATDDHADPIPALPAGIVALGLVATSALLRRRQA